MHEERGFEHVDTSEQELEALRAFVRERDVECPGCGYNLRGLTGRTCPECELALTLRVGLETPRTGKLLAAIIGLLLGAAPATMMLVVVLVMCGLTGNWPRRSDIWFVFGWPGAVMLILGPMVVALALPRGRAWFRKRSDEGADGVVWMSWLAGLGSVAIFVVILMRQR